MWSLDTAQDPPGGAERIGDVASRWSRESRWLPRLACVLAGAVFALVFPEVNAWWWAYVGLVPVLLLVRTAPSWREAFVRSWAGGCGFFVSLHHWLLPTLTVFAVPVVLLVGLVWVPFGLAAWWLLRDGPGPGRAAAAMVVLPSLWVLLEYVRSWELLGGSWGFVGVSQWQVHPVLALAAVGGVWALSFLLLATNVAATLVLSPSASPQVRVGVGMSAVLLVAAVVVYGATRPDPQVTGNLAIGGVQPGVVHDPSERLEENERITRALIDGDIEASVEGEVEGEPSFDPEVDLDLIVWGQSSVGFDLETADWARERLEDLADEAGVPLLVNVDARRPDGRVSKTTVVVRPDDGLAETYVKQRLVPFGEYVPLRPVFGWLEEFTDAATEDRMPGTDFTTFELAGATVGPLISYESTFPDVRRTLAREGVDMTLAQAAATTFQGMAALPQQASFEAVRAVESGRPSVLVAVSGTSSSFDPQGRQLAWVPQDATGAWTVEVPLSQEDTPFVRWGDWVPALSFVVVVTAALAAVAVARSGQGPRRQPRAASRNGHGT